MIIMNTLILTGILGLTILLAGVASIIPVEQATAVHTTIQDSQLEIKQLTDDDNLDADGQIEFACNKPFTLYSFFYQATVVDDDIYDIGVVEIDENDITGDTAGDLLVDSADVILVDDPAGAATVFTDVLAIMFGDADIYQIPMSAQGDIDFPIINAIQAADGDDADAIGYVVAETDAVCTVNIEVAD